MFLLKDNINYNMFYTRLISSIINMVSEELVDPQLALTGISGNPDTIMQNMSHHVSMLCDGPSEIYNGVELGDLPSLNTITNVKDSADSILFYTKLFDNESQYIENSQTMQNILSDIRQLASSIVNSKQSNITNIGTFIDLSNDLSVDKAISTNYTMSFTGCYLGYTSSFILSSQSILSFSVYGNGDPGNCREVIDNNTYIGETWNNPLSIIDNNFDTIFSYELCKLDEHVKVSSKSSTGIAGGKLGTGLLGQNEISTMGSPMSLSEFLGITNGYINGTMYANRDNLAWSRDPSIIAYDTNGNQKTVVNDDGLYLVIDVVLQDTMVASSLVITGIITSSSQQVPDVYSIIINKTKIPTNRATVMLTNNEVGPDVWTIEISLEDVQYMVNSIKLTLSQRSCYKAQLGYAYLKGSFSTHINSPSLTDIGKAESLKFDIYMDNDFNRYSERPSLSVLPHNLSSFTNAVNSLINETISLGPSSARFAFDTVMDSATYTSGIMSIPGKRYAINISEFQLMNKQYVEKAVITTAPISITGLRSIAIEVDDYIPSQLFDSNMVMPIKYYIKNGENILPILPVNRSYNMPGKTRYPIGSTPDMLIKPNDDDIRIVIELSRPPQKQYINVSPLVRSIYVGDF